jgi:hypothetical protein
MDAFIAALQNPAIYPHPVTHFQIIQTHLSWVILTGVFAYKIKKSLNLGFQDFTTLENRKYYCEKEVELNQRLAPQIYVGVIAITGSHQLPEFNGSGPPIEWAVKMHQFPQEALLSSVAKQGKLTPGIILQAAEQTARFHHNTPVCDPALPYGTAENVMEPIQQNFDTLKHLACAAEFIPIIERIELSAQKTFQILHDFLLQRKKQGYIRACHGDLHLGNMVLMGEQPLIFDCIEFNESFRWTDVMNDVSFMAMDLHHYQLPELAYLYVDQYLELTGDYLGAQLLSFYQSYRAMVRAKISALQMEQLANDDPHILVLQKDLKDFLALAEEFVNACAPQLTITMGVSGTGKTHHTTKILMKTGAIRLRSDVIRKQLKVAPKDLYSLETTQIVYAKLQSLAQDLLEVGHKVIIDAAFLQQSQRQAFWDLAKKLKVPFAILYFETPSLDVLRQRINMRLAQGKDQSDATEAVMHQQLSWLESLTPDEQQVATIIVNSD